MVLKVWSLDQCVPLEKGMVTTSVFLPQESHEQYEYHLLLLLLSRFSCFQLCATP